MSGIAVVLQRDGAPASLDALGAVLARLGHRGPDGEQAVSLGPVALGHRHFWVTPEEVGERQPLSDPTGRYWIACDGRIDNRDELLPALGVAAAEAGGTSDAAALLHAYERWGVPGFRRVVGSFAAAIWDAVERRLVLVRDALGDRTLCYAVTAEAVVAASEEHAVLAHPGVDGALDERRIAQFLGVAELDSDATFFTAVKEVLPGHAVVVEGGRTTAVRYWDLASAPELRPGGNRELAEAFAERLRAAVGAQTRSRTPVALLLSGGLDSSAIAAAAAAAAPRPVTAISWVFDELASCDERRWIDPVVRHCALPSLHFAGDGEWPFREYDAWRVNPSSPEDDLYRRLVDRARAAALGAGYRVVLSGMFGDHLYSGTHGWFWERLAMGSVLGAVAGVVDAVRQGGGLAGLRAALLPRRVPPLLGRMRAALTSPRPWLTPYAAALLAGPRTWPPAVDAALRPAQARSVLGLLAAHGVSGEMFHAASAGVETRYPYRDRRLVELVLRLPSDQLDRPGATRPVLRAAMRGRLPEAVRARVGKGSLNELFRRGFRERERAVVERWLDAGEPVWGRFVRRAALAGDAARTGREQEVRDLVACHCALLARWLDNRS